MPEIDLGPVIGPQGPKGDTGPQGEQGPQGPQGPAGEVDMDAAVAFTEASTRTNINSGESIKTIFGKIKKYFTDLKPHAFKAPANNFTTTDATTAAAAPTVKQLKEDFDELNSALAMMNAAEATDGSSFGKNFLGVGISDPNAETNKRAYFIAAPDQQADFTNVPPGLFNSGATTVGVREVYRRSSTIIMVKITEMLPKPGTQYLRTYNNGSWNSPGWKVISPE